MKIRRDTILFRIVAFCLTGLFFGFAYSESPVQTAMDGIVARLRAKFPPPQLLELDAKTVDQFITPEERAVLATQYWCFDVNMPVVVSVMRDVKQEIRPYWLLEAGFKKTGLVVRNEEYEYEVWQKAFPAGRVGLGINGFDWHRPHYFVSVNRRPGAELSNFFPAGQQVSEMRQGAYIYHDWSDLLLTEVPAELKGHLLLQTIRGRSREAHLIKAFRETPFASSAKPDQVVLTWSGDPHTTQTIQWRTQPSITTGVVRYKEKDAAAWKEAPARCEKLDDRMIINDRAVSHFTATLRDLKPAATYTYTVGGSAEDQRGGPAEFTTEPATAAPFTFLFLSDTHNSPVTGELLDAALVKYPQPAFCTIAGDLVGIGQFRDNWDQLLNHCRGFTARHALMPCIGNHDDIDGLGADLYRAEFELPANGPKALESKRAYSFEYGNALFLMLDVTAPIPGQTPWLEEKLAHSKAAWKFAVFHFPAYAPDDKTPEILDEWVPLFDKYHVDFALSGHVHHYLRTQPMKAGKPVDTPAQGTIYMISVSVAGGRESIPRPDYAAAFDTSGTPLCVAFTVEDKQVVVRALDKQGHDLDECVVTK